MLLGSSPPPVGLKNNHSDLAPARIRSQASPDSEMDIGNPVPSLSLRGRAILRQGILVGSSLEARTNPTKVLGAAHWDTETLQ